MPQTIWVYCSDGTNLGQGQDINLQDQGQGQGLTLPYLWGRQALTPAQR